MESAAVQLYGEPITPEQLVEWPVASAEDFLLLCAAVRLRAGSVEYTSFCEQLQKRQLQNRLVYINSTVTPPRQVPHLLYAKACFPLLGDAEALACWWTEANAEAKGLFCETLRACHLALSWTPATGWRLISDERY